MLEGWLCSEESEYCSDEAVDTVPSWIDDKEDNECTEMVTDASSVLEVWGR